MSGEVLRASLDWVPSAGLSLSLRMDGFAWMFATLVMAIGLLVVVYAQVYMAGKDRLPRFFALLMAFTGAMQGILLSGNLLLMVVFWELTSIVSFLLIGFWHQGQAARDGARTALLITAMGGLCLLLAMLMLGHVVGSHDLDVVLAAGPQVREHPMYGAILALFLLGAFTKSAQFPFHFWLPHAMAAPTPVSAYLHSATMVKAGVFLLIRFSPVLGGTEAWFLAVTGIGMVTFLTGGVMALFQHDLKGLLAYSTISHLGLITALAGIGSQGAILAAIFHICNHAVFKASLFMTAGIIDHQTGTRDLRKLGGLARVMPFTATLAIIASAAMAGVPLLNGFLSKEMFLAEAVAWHNGSWLDDSLPYLAVVASAFSAAYAIRFIASVFFGPLPHALRGRVSEAPVLLRLPGQPAGRTSSPGGGHPARAGDRPRHQPRRARRAGARPALLRHRDLARGQCGADAQPGVPGRGHADLCDDPDPHPPGPRRPAPAAPPARAARLRPADAEGGVGPAPPRAGQAGDRTAAAAAAPAGGGRAVSGRRGHRRAVPLGTPGAGDRFQPGIRADVVDRRGLRCGCGVAGQVPPLCRAGDAGRRRPGGLPDLPLAVRPGPGLDPADGRNRDHHPDSAGPALAAPTPGGPARGRTRHPRAGGGCATW